MRDLSDFESELLSLIEESLNLDLSDETVDPSAALFGDGLGLDSIDALELSMAVSRQYGVQLRSDDPDNERIFASLESLASHVQAHRSR